MIGLILPHQLFEDLAAWRVCEEVYVIEEHLFFRQYNFHQQKISYHRASMTFYQSYLQANGISVKYIESTDTRSDIRNLLSTLAGKELRYLDAVDNWLEKRITQSCAASSACRSSSVATCGSGVRALPKTTTVELIPSFWDSTTGILPLDQTIKQVLKTGYCNHIERLMVLGNFMLLCEFDPDEVYRWVMQLFIDAYDWVMVPNVYGMSQFADGGLMATKPYISGSNYLLKMSNYPKGPWQEVWDALFWRFMHAHRSFFSQNPRLGMLLKTIDKWDAAKQAAILGRAESYLAGLDSRPLRSRHF